jgi:cytochrome P450
MSEPTIRSIPTVSLWDNVRYNLLHVLPYFLQGIFTRNRFWVSLFARVHPDPMGVRFVSEMRRKYGSDYFYLNLLASKSLAVLDLEGVKHVLDNSPYIYRDPPSKHSGMSHFQPGAVTISRGDEWRERRRFNEAVLDSGEPVHRHAERFLCAVREEITARRRLAGPEWTWPDVDDLFGKISMRVIFGTRARDDALLLPALKQMMRESNRTVLLRKSKVFDEFYRRIRVYLHAPEPGSLAFDCARTPSTETTRVENQIPHWMFATDETLATNTVRALALIVSHPEVEQRVRAELAAADLTTPEGIDGLRYLEACVQDAMRLWPTTPMLAREAAVDDRLGGEVVPAQTQVLILNTFNHRDREAFPEADTFSPDLWLDGRASANHRFNHLSHGPQVCAGVNLLLFAAKAFLATLLAQDRMRLVRPTLDPLAPMPHAFNYFDLAIARTPIG